MSTTIYRRDQTAPDHEAVRQRQALSYAITQLQQAAHALQTARPGDDGMRDAVLVDAHRRLESMTRELRSLT